MEYNQWIRWQMKRKLFECIFSMLLLILITTPNFAASYPVRKAVPVPDGITTYANVLLDGAPLSFDNAPIALNDDIFVPAAQLYTILGIQTYWFEDTGELVGYRDNTFIKFKMNRDIVYVNGSAIKMKTPAFMRDGIQFVPMKVIADAFSMTYNYDKTTHTLALDFRENIYQYKQIGFRQYKKITTTNWGISYFIPEYWEALEGNNNAYGVSNDFETYAITPQVLPLDSSFNRNILASTLEKNMRYTYGRAIDFGDVKLSVYNGFLCSQTDYDLTLDDRAYKGSLYIFFENNIGYAFDCLYDAQNSLYEGEDIFNAVMDTFQISKITIDENAEHYIELNKFFVYRTTLSAPIYSNMMADGQFRFEGYVENNEDNRLKGYHIVIKKDTETIAYYAPLMANQFSASVPLPFGVGKHDISIYVDEFSDMPEQAKTSDLSLDDYIEEVITDDDDSAPEDLIMRFSVINTSDAENKYLLPSAYIDFDNNDVYTIANSITYDQTSEYGKAKSVYTWVLKNYAYTEDASNQVIYTAHEMLGYREGSDFELTLLYTGLLRALDIQARVIRGTSADYSHYWVEVYLNGKWIVTDIASDVMSKNIFSTQKYFDIDRTLHGSQYEKTELLPF
jgi:transglutaminase-like putative cysteine protease